MSPLRPGREFLFITVSKTHTDSHFDTSEIGMHFNDYNVSLSYSSWEVNGDRFTLTYQTSLNEFGGAEEILDIS